MNCIVCSKSSKYKCPRCVTPYCSLPHYKSHNLFCTEGFYKQQVEQDLKNLKVSPEEKNKMRQILKEDEQSEVPDFAKQRMEDILEKIQNNEEVKLTHDEEVRFAQWLQKWVIQEGETPFWEIQEGLSCYYVTQVEPQETNQNNQDEHQEIIFYRKQFKSIIDTLPPITSLCANVNPLLVYHIYGLVYAGCIIFRYFNNDITSSSSQASSLLLSIYPLNSLPSFESIADVHYFVSIQKDYQLIKPWIQLVKMDIGKIFKNKYLVLEMLLRLNDLVKSKRINKKIDFYCSYIKDVDNKLATQIQNNLLRQQIAEQGQQHLQKYKDLLVFK